MRKFQFSLRTLVVGVLTVSGLLLLSAWHFDWGHQPFEDIPEFKGLSETAVTQRLGRSAIERDDLLFNPPAGPDDLVIESSIPKPPPNNPFASSAPPEPSWGKNGGKIRELVWPHHSYSVSVLFMEHGNTWEAVWAWRLQDGAENPFRPSEERMKKLLEACSGGGFRLITEIESSRQ